MLILHHLNDSRSQRILWLLEELGTPYEMRRYQRDAKTRLAPVELAAVHPLGKSPVIVDGGIRIAESAAIVDYLIRTYGKGAMMPAVGTHEYEAYNEWLHYAEGSAMLPLMLNLYVSRLKEAGKPLHSRIDSEIANHLGYVEGALQGREFFVGNTLTGADIQMSFVAKWPKYSTSSHPIRILPAGSRACMPVRRSAARSKKAAPIALRIRTSAANLKFLSVSRQVRDRNFKFKAALELTNC
jgi:glutathione S-transferase